MEENIGRVVFNTYPNFYNDLNESIVKELKNRIEHADRYFNLIYNNGDEFSKRIALEYIKEFNKE